MLITVIFCGILTLLSSFVSCEEQEQAATSSSASSSSATAAAPIYVSFQRWENRTFSPRVYYYILVNQRPSITTISLPDNQTSTARPPLSVPPSPASAPSGLNNNQLGSSPTLAPQTESEPSEGPSDEDEDELNPNHLNLFATRLNTPRPGASGKNKNKIKQSSIQFPSSSGTSTGANDETKTLLKQQYGLGTLAPPPDDEYQFTFPSTSLLLSNATSDGTKSGAENEILKDRSGVSSYIKHRDEPQRQPPPSPPLPPPTPSPKDEIEIDSYGLSFDIFRVSKNDWKSKNILFSPFSYLNIMAVLLLGANGTTFKELTQQLRPTDPDAIVRNEVAYHSSFQKLLHVLSTGSGENVALDIFNGVFVDSSFTLRPPFRQAALDLYGAQTSSFDFGHDAEEFKNKVNELVAFKTRDKIKTVLDGPVDPSTTLALINTVYFRGSWEKPFIPKITKKRSFHVTANSSDSINIDMMMNVLTVPYLEAANYRVVGLPYKGNKTGFFILLPKRPGIEGLQEMEANMTRQDFFNLFTMKETPVAIQLPKMRVEGADAEAKQLFKRLGLGSLFDPRTADLSRVSDTNGLYIKSIVHKAILDLDESGTEAAAASVATGDRIIDDNPPVQFNVNQPFAFCIIHIQAKTVLFMGRVTRPTPLPSSLAPVAGPSPRTTTGNESDRQRAQRKRT